MHGFKIHLLLACCIFLSIDPSGHAQTFSVLYDFGSGSQDPVNPTYPGTIAQGRDGNLYSTSPNSLYGQGAAFTITPSGTFTVLYSFTSEASGANPFSGLVLGTNGNFYGTTEYGGTDGDGIVFEMTPHGQITVLYNLTDDSGGEEPYAPPIQGAYGSLYGTTAEFNYQQGIFGTVYKLTPAGVLTTLYQFDQAHGASPYTPLVEGTDGDFYGVTLAGGNLNLGVVFKITPSGKFNVLYNFDGRHGSQPFGPLVQGNDGNFYGTTYNGGSNGSGVVFRITPGGTLKVIHNFEGTGAGFYPCTALVQASDGNFYGTTHSGGAADAGTIFRISPEGQYSVLYRFNGTNGKFPLVTLTQHTNGILYGDTSQGGTVSCPNSQNCGTFYSLNLGLPPFVSLAPLSAKVGKEIEFLGQGFTGSTAVSFNGVAASFKVLSDTFLTAVVPSGATTGFVTVTTPGGELKSNREFHVKN